MKKLYALVFGLYLMIAPISAGAFYTDVVPQSLYKDAIFYFYDTYPILNTEKSEFKPMHKVTKVEFLKLILNSAGYVIENTGNIDLPYYDTIDNSWYAPYINKALEIGLLEYNEFEPNFFPGNEVSRSEGLSLIVKMYGIPMPLSYNTDVEYQDIENSTPLAPLAKITYQFKLLPDFQSLQFWPYKGLTRAEVVTILYKLHTEYRTYKWLDSTENLVSTEITYPEIQSDVTQIDQFDIFLDVWDELNTNYIDQQAINKDKLLYGAIDGMVSELDDPYSEYFVPVDAQEYYDDLEGEFEGIGVYIIEEDGKIIVVSPLRNSPAEKAGIEPNDEIIEVDGMSLTGMSLEEVIDEIVGATGTKVEIKVKRDSSTYIFTIVREQILIEFVETEVLEQNIGYVSYSQFSGKSNLFFLQKLNDLKKQGVEKLIIDLRNNPGGYLESAHEFISYYVTEGEVVFKLIYADKSSQDFESFGDASLANMETVILINEGSASAAELVSLILQEKGIVKLVGQKSYGKGKVQDLINYNDGSSLKLSTSIWTSPNNISIDLVGITPDYEIIENDQTEIDEQLEKALELLR